MKFLTVHFERTPSADERAQVEAALRERGGSIEWATRARAGRTYGLASLPDDAGTLDLNASTQARIRDTAIIALAVFPTLAEALPQLLEALGGEGRPEGVLSCLPCDGGVVVEWDPRRTRAAAIRGLIDTELRRFSSGSTAELLSPLPPDIVLSIAAEGLQTPDIAPGRELETLLERAGVSRV